MIDKYITKIFSEKENHWIIPSMKANKFLSIKEDKDGISSVWLTESEVTEAIKNGPKVNAYRKIQRLKNFNRKEIL